MRELAAKFIPAADEVGRLQSGRDAECRLFQKVAEQGHYAGRTRPSSTRQGTYATTADGTFLASWNNNNPRVVARKLREALGLGEGRLAGGPVTPAALACPDPAEHRLAVGRELDHRVVARVGDQEASGRCPGHPAGKAQGGLGRRWGNVRSVAAVQRAAGVVLGDEVVNQPADGLGVALAGGDGDDVPLGVDDDKRRPGADRVLLPSVQLGIVEDGVAHLVPLHGVGDHAVVGLVRELRRVDADHHQDVRVAFLERPELVDHV